MALCIGSSSRSTSSHLLSIPSDANPKTPRIAFTLHLGRSASESHVARARRVSSRSKKSNLTTTPQKDSEQQLQAPSFPEDAASSFDGVDDGFVVPDLPGEKPDFWEGPQWNAFGLFVQYMWAFGIGFALIACGIAVATYNEGATDFKETPAYKESTQTRELLDAPDASSSDVFEGNPTEEAPSLE